MPSIDDKQAGRKSRSIPTMLIRASSAEQLQYLFTGIPSKINYSVLREHLPTGDYVSCQMNAFKEGRTCAVVERKSLSDFYTTISNGRDRFVRELQRMESFGYRAVAIEASMEQIANPNDYLKRPTKMKPKSAIASILAWSQRHGVHFITCGSREMAERITFRILERWFNDGNP